MINPNNRKKPSAMGILAGRIANLAIPATANNIYAKIQQSHARRFGAGRGMGIASDPRQWFMQSNQFTDKLPLGIGSTMSIMDAQKRIDLETRTQLANRTGVSLPQFMGPLKQGIASPMQQQTSSNIQEQRTTGGNSMYVEDSRWPVTLAQILGSKMLTQEQLKAASIQNVSTMFNVQGGTKDEKAEMYYMFQRFMLEGYIRGVDVTKDFKSNGGKNPRFTIYLDQGSTVAGNPNNIGVSKQGEVRFNVDYMRRNDDNVKLSLFYHEMGHELLNREHSSTPGIMKSGGSNAAGKKLTKSVTDYNQLMGDLYGPNGGRMTGGYNHLKIPVQRNQNAQYDPSWFPSATQQEGGYAPDGTGGGNPNAGGSNYQNTSITNTTYNPFQPNTETGQAMGAAGVTLSQPDTLDVPNINLPNQTGVGASQGFAAGVSSVGQQQEVSLEGMAGALTKLAAG